MSRRRTVPSVHSVSAAVAVRKPVAPVLPFGISSIPEVSMVGATEEELQKKGILRRRQGELR